jgi:adenosylcobinamide-GDP ribazoletransferase
MSKLTKPVGEGLGHALGSSLSRATTLAAAAQGIAITLLLALRLAPALLLAAALLVWATGAYFRRRLGGVSGDCLGATGQVIECVCLLVFVWARSI